MPPARKVIRIRKRADSSVALRAAQPPPQSFYPPPEERDPALESSDYTPLPAPPPKHSFSSYYPPAASLARASSSRLPEPFEEETPRVAYSMPVPTGAALFDSDFEPQSYRSYSQEIQQAEQVPGFDPYAHLLEEPQPEALQPTFEDEPIEPIDDEQIVPLQEEVETPLAPPVVAAATPAAVPLAPLTQRLLDAPTNDPRLDSPVWEVWIEGGDPIGPVSAHQIARGIRAGKVPSDASVKRATDTFWADLLDAPDVVAALSSVSSESAPPPPTMSPSLKVRQFLVWVEGSDPVGPVSADQIARGIRAGKVPTDASIQRTDDFFACDVLDEPDIIAALKYI